MFRKTVLIIIALLIAVVFPTIAFAEGSDTLEDITSQINTELDEAMDDEVRKALEERGIDLSENESIPNIKPENVFAHLWQIFVSTLSAPMKVMGKILAVTVIYAAVKALYDEPDGAGSAFGVCCVACVITAMADILTFSFNELRSALETVNNFMIAYIPIFTSVTAAGGYALTAGSYSAATVLLCEVVELVANSILLPLISAITALCVVSAINPQLRLGAAVQSVKKFVTWLLATLMLIFVGLLSIQGIVGSSADDLAAKTLRFAASSFVPVIGGSVSEAYTAVRGSLGVIRSAVGGIGVFTVVIIAARPVFLLLSIKVTLWAGKLANDVLSLNETSDFLKSISDVLSIGLSVLLTASAAFIISTAAVLAAALGGA